VPDDASFASDDARQEPKVETSASFGSTQKGNSTTPALGKSKKHYCNPGNLE
jgi:hypothetical protein